MDCFEMLEVVIEVFRAKINTYTFLVWTKLVHLLVPNLWKIPGAPVCPLWPAVCRPGHKPCSQVHPKKAPYSSHELFEEHGKKVLYFISGASWYGCEGMQNGLAFRPVRERRAEGLRLLSWLLSLENQ